MTKQQHAEAEKIISELYVVRHYIKDLIEMKKEDRMDAFPFHIRMISNDSMVKTRIQSLNECSLAVLQQIENDLENNLRAL